MNGQGLPVADRLIEDVMGLWRLVRLAAHPAHPAHQSGVTAEQFWLLLCLERHCPMSVGTLAEVLGITPSSATSACKRLEQAGLVTRTRQAADERVVEIELTERGRAQLAEMRRRQREALGRLLGALDPQEQITLQQLLDRVLAAGGRRADDQPYCSGAGARMSNQVEGRGSPRSTSILT